MATKKRTTKRERAEPPRGELETYRSKRDFARTPEPGGRKGRGRAGSSGDLAFVVQKHAARRLHYDFRLEWDGVLLSWAVPKGPVPDPSVKRLAMRTEDHPLEYGDFEGVIPEGQYGGGTVMLWDRGVWRPEGSVERGLRDGKLDFTLEGEKLRGRWTLVRTGEERGKEAWLLIKRTDDEARRGSDEALLEERPLSVASGRSMDEIATDRLRVWSSDEPDGGPQAGRRGAAGAGAPDVARIPGARSAPLPRTFRPQLATLVDEAPAGEEWIHEIKFDGYRLLCRIDGSGDVRLLTRTGNDWTGRFPRLARAAAELPVREAILDGEAVVLDRQGRSDFQALQQALGAAGEAETFFYAFDLPHLDGQDLTGAPLHERKAALAALLEQAPAPIRYSEHVAVPGPRFRAEACRLGLEGVVSKRSDAAYVEGRTRTWLKSKCVKRQEFVVVGWTEPQGKRSGIGSLVLGVHDDGRLVYAGRVGTGFDAATAEALRAQLEPRGRKSPPVEGAPPSARGRRIHWVRPELVAEVAFTEWTADGAVRHPSFQGLREDRDPAEVVREREEPVDTEKAEAAREGGTPATRRRRDRPASPRPRGGTTQIAGVRLTNPDRVLYPDEGITKEELARYWLAVAPHALPYLARRPLTLVRCPEGIARPCFYQKHAMEGVPDAVRRVVVPEKSGEDKPEPYLMVEDAAGLVGLAQVGILEVHVWNARADRLDRPDQIVMDVDPGPDVPWKDVVLAATAIRDLLSEMGLRSWPRATGGKGLHVVVPLERRAGWAEVKGFARAIARLMVSAAPDRFVAKAAKDVREGKVYVDYLRNGRNATAIGTFSPRARAGAPVAVPLSWEETEASKAPPRRSLREVLEIDPEALDPWTGFFETGQSITEEMRGMLGM